MPRAARSTKLRDRASPSGALSDAGTRGGCAHPDGTPRPSVFAAFAQPALRSMRCLLSLALLLPLATAQHTRWADRLGTRVGRPIEPPSPPPPPQMPSEAVLAELRTFVERTVEPSIALMRAHELERGNDETCFASSGGQHLRYRCCVYFTALSAALLEWRFGEAPGAATTWRVLSPLAYDAERPVPDRQLLYGLLARWFLQPPAAAQLAAVSAHLGLEQPGCAATTPPPTSPPHHAGAGPEGRDAAGGGGRRRLRSGGAAQRGGRWKQAVHSSADRAPSASPAPS
jgi:hypothetical protein